jgi:hypothetical protein
VDLADVRTGATRFVPCDTLVFSGDWIPDHELAWMAGLVMDRGTRGREVDTALETSAAGVFGAGNLVHAAETADIAALSGRHAAQHIAAALRAQPRGAGLAGAGLAGAGLSGARRRLAVSGQPRGRPGTRRRRRLDGSASQDHRYRRKLAECPLGLLSLWVRGTVELAQRHSGDARSEKGSLP